VQKVREAASRLKCQNNLKQIGLGLHNYHDARLSLPPGHVWKAPGFDTNACDATWITHLLPFVEQDNLHRQIDWTRGFNQMNLPGHPNAPVAATPLVLFECPSNTATAQTKPFAKGSYVANNGIGPNTESTTGDLPLARQGGVFSLNSRVRMAQIADGTSQTALVSEVIMVVNDNRGFMHYTDGPLYHHNHLPNSPTPDEIRTPGCNSVPGAPCVGAFTGWNPRSLLHSARSRHPGGVNLLLADGSVRFVANGVDPATWRNLSSPAGGEVVGDF
jgi:prepilin-type processing-associated H-X9-DG protein